MFRFCTFLLQRRSASSTVDAAIKASRSRDFFKRRWLEKRFSKRLTQTIPYSVAREGVVIELDSRETSLVSCLNIIAPAVPLSVSQLGEGDVVITESNKRIVIERKTIEDFYNSINSKDFLTKSVEFTNHRLASLARRWLSSSSKVRCSPILHSPLPRSTRE